MLSAHDFTDKRGVFDAACEEACSGLVHRSQQRSTRSINTRDLVQIDFNLFA
jgi:hypothetical protein